jgi:acyl-CoA reductase-like NAD-dependent aldehyde dehydrogenase
MERHAPAPKDRCYIKAGVEKIREYREELWRLMQRETGKTVAMSTDVLTAAWRFVNTISRPQDVRRRLLSYRQ